MADEAPWSRDQPTSKRSWSASAHWVEESIWGKNAVVSTVMQCYACRLTCAPGLEAASSRCRCALSTTILSAGRRPGDCGRDCGGLPAAGTRTTFTCYTIQSHIKAPTKVPPYM